MRRRVREPPKNLDVVGRGTEAEIGDEHGEGLATQSAVLHLVDEVIQRRLIKLDGVLEVLQRSSCETDSTRTMTAPGPAASRACIGGGILDLTPRQIRDQVLKRAPGGFERLEAGVMEDLLDLAPNDLVQSIQQESSSSATSRTCSASAARSADETADPREPAV